MKPDAPDLNGEHTLRLGLEGRLADVVGRNRTWRDRAETRRERACQLETVLRA